MLLNRGLEVSGLDFEDVEIGKVAQRLALGLWTMTAQLDELFANPLGAPE